MRKNHFFSIMAGVESSRRTGGGFHASFGGGIKLAERFYAGAGIGFSDFPNPDKPFVPVMAKLGFTDLKKRIVFFMEPGYVLNTMFKQTLPDGTIIIKKGRFCFHTSVGTGLPFKTKNVPVITLGYSTYHVVTRANDDYTGNGSSAYYIYDKTRYTVFSIRLGIIL